MNLLVLEDDLALRNVMQRLFEPIVDHCDSAETLAEALKKIVTNPKFDIVTVDLNVPDSRGLDTLTEIRRACPDAIIIVYTGSLNHRDEQEALSSGADGFLTKSEVMSTEGGFLQSFKTVLQKLIHKPMKPGQSIDLLEKLVERISARVQLERQTNT